MPDRPPFRRIPDAADAVAVLGAQVLAGGMPSTALRRRVAHGVALLARLPGAVLVCCGGVGDAPPAEALVMASLAVRLGVPPGRLVIEDGSRSTMDQAEAVAEMVRREGWERVVVVTDRYHLPRARFLFRAAGVTVSGSGCGRGDGSLARWWGGVVREVPAWVKTLLTVSLRRAVG
jgi:uncharacterized SAM-binding protein YcdF (DUF218 family)